MLTDKARDPLPFKYWGWDVNGSCGDWKGNESLELPLEKQCGHDFNEIVAEDKEIRSREEIRFIKIMEQSEVARWTLQFKTAIQKTQEVTMPNNRCVAQQCLIGIGMKNSTESTENLLIMSSSMVMLKCPTG